MDDGVSSTRFYLVRHGHVDEAWQGLIYGDLDAPLSAAGKFEARRVAEMLADVPLVAVVSSGLPRAEFGAASIRCGRNLSRRDEPALREIRRGEWGGLALTEIERRWPGSWARWWADPERERPPGGESLEDLSHRVMPCMTALSHEYTGGEVAIVAHSWVIRIIACAALGLSPGGAKHFDLAPGAVAILDVRGVCAGELTPQVLAGFACDRPPNRGEGWFRGPPAGANGEG